MHNNAHDASNANEYLGKFDFKNNYCIASPSCSLNLNHSENIWNIVKKSVYGGGMQFVLKNEFWEAMLPVCKIINPEKFSN